MAAIDLSFKITAHSSGREMCRLAHIVPDVWEPIGDTLQTTERLADRAFRATQGEERFVVYFEAYIEWRNAARWNILAKSGLLSEREELPTRTLVFILTPDGYREQNGTFQLQVGGSPTQQIWFHEICLWREKSQPWWEEAPGLMALLPLCDHGRSEEMAVRHAADSILERLPDDTSERRDLLATLTFFGNLAYPALDVMRLIGVQHMRTSKFAEELIAMGRVEARRADVLNVLEDRFGPEKTAGFVDAVNAIEDADKLSALLLLATKSRSIAAFRRALSSSTS